MLDTSFKSAYCNGTNETVKLAKQLFYMVREGVGCSSSISNSPRCEESAMDVQTDMHLV